MQLTKLPPRSHQLSSWPLLMWILASLPVWRTWWLIFSKPSLIPRLWRNWKKTVKVRRSNNLSDSWFSIFEYSDLIVKTNPVNQAKVKEKATKARVNPVKAKTRTRKRATNQRKERRSVSQRRARNQRKAKYIFIKIAPNQFNQSTALIQISTNQSPLCKLSDTPTQYTSIQSIFNFIDRKRNVRDWP